MEKVGFLHSYILYIFSLYKLHGEFLDAISIWYIFKLFLDRTPHFKKWEKVEFVSVLQFQFSRKMCFNLLVIILWIWQKWNSLIPISQRMHAMVTWSCIKKIHWLRYGGHLWIMSSVLSCWLSFISLGPSSEQSNCLYRPFTAVGKLLSMMCLRQSPLHAVWLSWFAT